jgi:hypothetical protein
MKSERRNSRETTNKRKIKYPRHWWLSCSAFTCYVASDEDDFVMKQSAPIVRRFRGQHIKRLVRWMKDIGGFMCAEYNEDKELI